jgi:very-short-patch-repair endonuclease
MKKTIIQYKPWLKAYAKKHRNCSTRSEIRMWRYLKGKQLLGYRFHRQKPVDCFILDFFCFELMLGIELDGYTHLFAEVIEKDIRKEYRLRQLGITVLRFTDDEVFKDIDNVLKSLEGWIQCNKNNNLKG